MPPPVLPTVTQHAPDPRMPASQGDDEARAPRVPRARPSPPEHA